jgi:hypothetical protein
MSFETERVAACLLDPWYRVESMSGFQAIRVHGLPVELHGHHHADVLLWLYENDSERLAGLFEDFLLNKTSRDDRRVQIVELFQKNVAEHVLKDGVAVRP